VPVNLTGPRHEPARSSGRWARTRPIAIGPHLGFGVAVGVGFAAWAAWRATLPADMVMPLLATLLLLLAAAFAAIAWWRGRMDPGGVTYLDVAGALTLIGVCAAATIDSEQILRLAQLQTGRTE
jgi:hypothetical protein